MGLAPLLLVAWFATSPRPEDDAPPPNRELLEFIASFQTADGEWIDPLSLPGAEPQDEDEADSEVQDAADAADTDPQR